MAPQQGFTGSQSVFGAGSRCVLSRLGVDCWPFAQPGLCERTMLQAAGRISRSSRFQTAHSMGRKAAAVRGAEHRLTHCYSAGPDLEGLRCRDFESLTLMRMRQKAERERLIADLAKEDAR